MRSETLKLSGWGNYPQMDCNVISPGHISDISRIFDDTSKMIARGLGRSYSDQAIGETVIPMTPVNRIISFDPDKGVLHCEAGLSLEEIIEIFTPRGWFPFITPGTRFVTVGGAIANDVHGKAHHVDGSFIESVLSLEILTGKGEILEISRKKHPDLFNATFGGLGLTGIILSAKIKLRKIETTFFKQKAFAVNNITEMFDIMEQADSEYDYSVAWVNPLAQGQNLGKGVITVGNAAGLNDLPEELRSTPLIVAPRPGLNVPFFLPDITLNAITLRVLNQVIHYVQNSSRELAHYNKFFYPLDAINNWNRGYGKRGFIQYQFVVPEQDGRQRMKELVEMVAKSGCNPFLNVLKKFGAKPGGLIAFPMAGYNFAIDFPLSKELLAFTKKLDQAVLERGGRVYAGKDGVTDGATFHKMYGKNLEKFLKIRKKYDPNGKFSSSISKRLQLD